MQQFQSEQQEEQTLETFQESLQQGIFIASSSLLNHLQTFKPWLYYLCTAIETLQILWFSLHPNFQFQNYSIGIPTLKLILSKMNVNWLLSQDPSLRTLFVSLALTIVVVYTCSITLCYYLISKDGTSKRIQNLLLGIVCFQVIIFNRALVAPLVDTVASIAVCNPKTRAVCYDAQHAIQTFLVSIVGLILLLSILVSSFLLYSKNPFENGFIGMRSNIPTLAKTGIKIMGCIYFVIDPNGAYMMVYTYTYACVWLAFLFFFRLWNNNYNNKRFYFLQYFSEIAILLSSLISIMQYNVSKEAEHELTLVYGILVYVPLCYTAYSLEVRNDKSIRQSLSQDRSQEEQQTLILYLIRLVEAARTANKLSGFLPIVWRHQQKCDKSADCVCRQYMTQYKAANSQSLDRHFQLCYRFIGVYIQQSIKAHPRAATFRLLQMYLFYYRLDCKVRSLISCHEAAQCKPSIMEKFEISHIIRQFEKQTIVGDMLRNQTFLQANAHLAYSKAYLKFQNTVQRYVQTYTEFWMELLQEQPSVLKLCGLCRSQTRSQKDIAQNYLECNAIFPYERKTTIIYSEFLRTFGSAQHIREADGLIQNLFACQKQSDQIVKLPQDNQNRCIICVGSSKGVIETITNCNSQVRGMYGFERKDLCGHKIYKMMPKAYHEMHQEFMSKYISNNDTLITQPKYIMTLVLDKGGFCIMCRQLIKIAPSVTYGFEFINFIERWKDNDDTLPSNYILFNDTTGVIEGMSQMSLPSLKLQEFPTVVLGQNINLLFPQTDFNFLTDSSQKPLQSVIDTRLLVPGITHDEIEMLNLEVNETYRLPINIMVDRSIRFRGNTLKRVKFSFLSDAQSARLVSDHKQVEIDPLSVLESIRHAKCQSILNALQKTQQTIAAMFVNLRLPYKIKMLSLLAMSIYVLVITDISLETKMAYDSGDIQKYKLSLLNDTMHTHMLASQIMEMSMAIARSTYYNTTDNDYLQLGAALNIQISSMKTMVSTWQRLSHNPYSKSSGQLVKQQFVTSTGVEQLSIIQALNLITYSAQLLYLSSKQTFKAYPALPITISSHVRFISENCPQNLPLLIDKLSAREMSSLDGFLDNQVITKVSIFYVMFSLVCLLALLSAYLSFIVNRYFSKLLQLYNNVKVSKAEDIKLKSEQFVRQYLYLNNSPQQTTPPQHVVLEILEETMELDNKNKKIKQLIPQAINRKPLLISMFLLTIVSLLLGGVVERSLEEIRIRQATKIQCFTSALVSLGRTRVLFQQVYQDNSTLSQLFNDTVSRLYEEVEQLYSLHQDQYLTRPIIYGQVEQMKYLLTVSANTSEVNNLTQQLAKAINNMQEQLSENQNKINIFFVSIFDTVMKIKFSIVILLSLVSAISAYKYLLQTMLRRNQAYSEMMRMFPVDCLPEDKQLKSIFQ